MASPQQTTASKSSDARCWVAFGENVILVGLVFGLLRRYGGGFAGELRRRLLCLGLQIAVCLGSCFGEVKPAVVFQWCSTRGSCDSFGVSLGEVRGRFGGSVQVRRGVLTRRLAVVVLVVDRFELDDVVEPTLEKSQPFGQVLSWLLDRDMNPDLMNRYEQTPLMVAAMNGKLSCVQKLFNAGANIEGAGTWVVRSTTDRSIV
ncbi:hypothetical protein Droror1_Dr00023089 [Drosera rotundifolia]